jgi:hypothetical protein
LATRGAENSSRLSLFYVLFSLVATTELFTTSLSLNVNCRAKSISAFIHSPADAGDILNLVQFTLVLVLWLVM